jgi:beta-mannosidase
VASYIWWIWELGNQPLFNLTATIENVITKQKFTKYVENIGFRTVKVNQNSSSGGAQFTINLNGIDIYARGGNYIPP